MKDREFKLSERELTAKVTGISETRINPFRTDMTGLEMISGAVKEKPYVSPIFTMSEDEILAFVEEFDVRELATLSVAELNRIGEVLGVDPEILAGVEDL